MVCVRWKPSAGLSDEWFGTEANSSSPGFVILTSRPVGAPAEVAPNTMVYFCNVFFPLILLSVSR